MPKTYTLLCPFHQVEETLTLPDSYSNAFDGEVPCGGPEGPKATLRITVLRDQLMKVEVVGRPSQREIAES